MRDDEALRLPTRTGGVPLTSTRGRVEQITQPVPEILQRILLEMAAALPGVRIGPSLMCIKGTRAYHLDPGLALGPAQAFFAATEFGHIHPVYDGSLHLRLPAPVVAQTIAARWGLAADPEDSVLVYGPRDLGELDTVWQLVLAAHRYAAPGSTQGGVGPATDRQGDSP